MIAQQLQHANIMANAGANSVTLFEAAAKLGEAFRKLPVAIDIRVIDRSGATSECRQIMHRIKDFSAIFVVPHMRRDQFFIVNHFHMIDDSFDRHGLESHLSRHAVADFVEAYHLIFINRYRASHAGFEGVSWQRSGLLNVEFQDVADGEL